MLGSRLLPLSTLCCLVLSSASLVIARSLPRSAGHLQAKRDCHTGRVLFPWNDGSGTFGYFNVGFTPSEPDGDPAFFVRPITQPNPDIFVYCPGDVIKQSVLGVVCNVPVCL